MIQLKRKIGDPPAARHVIARAGQGGVVTACGRRWWVGQVRFETDDDAPVCKTCSRAVESRCYP